MHQMKRQQWFVHVIAKRESDLSVRDYCTREGLELTTFVHWEQSYHLIHDEVMALLEDDVFYSVGMILGAASTAGIFNDVEESRLEMMRLRIFLERINQNERNLFPLQKQAPVFASKGQTWKFNIRMYVNG